MDYLLAILNATLCVHATEHSIHRVTQIEFEKIQCYPIDISFSFNRMDGFSDHKHSFLSHFANNTKF